MAMPTKTPNPSLTAFAVELADMHQRAHRLGLFETGHALHEAVQKVGWEIAYKLSLPRQLSAPSVAKAIAGTDRQDHPLSGEYDDYFDWMERANKSPLSWGEWLKCQP